MQSYCILKQPADPNAKTKIRVAIRSKSSKFENQRRSTNDIHKAYDIVKVRRSEKDALLFAFDAAFKSYEE